MKEADKLENEKDSIMDRRTFIGTTVAAVASTALPLHASTETIYDRILASFPTISNEYGKEGFFTMKENDNGRYLTVSKIQKDNWIENERLEDFVKNRFVTTEKISTSSDKKDIENVCNMRRTSNDIARRSRRGFGRFYSVIDDETVLVWYRGMVYIDTPIQTNGNVFYFSPQYENNFAKVNDISLTDSDHDKLKEIGYFRIV